MKKRFYIITALIMAAAVFSGCRAELSIRHKHPGEAAEQESAEELLAWGDKYMDGDDVEQDTVKALEYYNRAAAAGSADAPAVLGNFFEYGTGGSASDFKLARLYYRNAAERGNEYVEESLKRVEWKEKILEESPQISASVLNDRGDSQYSVQHNYGLALAYYELAAGQGAGRGAYSAGYMYDEGKGVHKDYRKAGQFYKKAMEAGNIEAMGKLADLYYYGRGITQNIDRAVELFTEGADNGDWYAQIRLGEIYEKGENGVKRNNKKALKYYRAALKNGAISAARGISRIADAYRYGEDAEQDMEKAFSLYKEAAESRDPYAALCAGEIYQTGSEELGLAPDYRMAAQYYGIAASANPERGPEAVIQAQYRLGYYYENGVGVEQDLSKAKENYRKAADEGYEPAQEALERLKSEG